MPSANGGSVLIVDDEADILKSLKSLLEATMPGVRVHTAKSGPEGLTVLAKERVDVLVTDYRMPGMNGVEFLSRAEAAHPDLATMLITAFPKLELAIDAINAAHVDRFLVKPFPPEDFVSKVQGLLAKRRAS